MTDKEQQNKSKIRHSQTNTVITDKHLRGSVANMETPPQLLRINLLAICEKKIFNEEFTLDLLNSLL